MSTPQEILNILSQLSVDQLQAILNQGHGRSPLRPRQLHDLRLPPTATDPRPTFIVTEAPRDVVITHSPYPALRWNETTGREITVQDAEEDQRLGPGWVKIPPYVAPEEPEERAARLFAELCPEDQQMVREMQAAQKRDAASAALSALSASQLQQVMSEPKRGPGRPKKDATV